MKILNRTIDKRHLILFLCAFLVCVIGYIIWLIHSRSYLPYITDDALISFRYAKRLIQGKGLTFNDGEFVEGYSNLLWVIVVALFGLINDNLIEMTRVIGYICSALTIGAMLYVLKPTIIKDNIINNLKYNYKKLLALLFGIVFLGLSGTIAVWTIGGLEQTLIFVLLAWIIALFFKRYNEVRHNKDSVSYKDSVKKAILPGILGGLLCITRPDSPLFIVSFCIGLFFLFGFNTKTLLKSFIFGLISATFYLGQLIFRIIYYGDFLPNTAYAKLALTETRLLNGIGYLFFGLYLILPITIFILILSILAFTNKHFRRKFVFLFIPAFIWSGYVIFIGGDIFVAFRHFVPIIVIFAFILAEAIRSISLHNMPFTTKKKYPQESEAIKKDKSYEERKNFQFKNKTLKYVSLTLNVLIIIFSIVMLTVFGFRQQKKEHKYNWKARYERWEYNGKVLGDMLITAFGEEQPLIAVNAAGALPYFTGFPTIDMLGLNDSHIAKHGRPKTFGKGFIGHELGDGKYVLSRNPDLVIMRGGGYIGGYYPSNKSGRELFREPKFKNNYTLSTFKSFGDFELTSKIWVNKKSEKIGIIHNENNTIIPAYFMTDNETYVTLDENGKIGMWVDYSTPAQISYTLEKGVWEISTEHTGSPVKLWVQETNSDLFLVRDNDKVLLQNNKDTPIIISVTSQSPNKKSHIKNLILYRRDINNINKSDLVNLQRRMSKTKNTRELPNHNFEKRNLSGWKVIIGNTFSNKDIATKNTIGRRSWPINKEKNYWLWSFKDGGDGQTGELHSKSFILGKDSIIDLLVSGGNDIKNLYVTLICDGKEIEDFKVTGDNSEILRRVIWDCSSYANKTCYIKIVDKSRNGWGHINIDDVNVRFKKLLN